jgi:acyl carrier protein
MDVIEHATAGVQKQESGGGAVTVNDQRIQDGVHQAVVEALGLEDDEVTLDSTLMDDLGAESIDLLDILFRLERKLGVKIKAADLAAYIQGDVPEGAFGDDDGVVTPAAMAQLKKVMPQLDTDELEGKLEAKNVIRLFTVQNLVTLVSERAAAASAA